MRLRLGLLFVALVLTACSLRFAAPQGVSNISPTAAPTPTALPPKVTGDKPSPRVGAFYYPWYGTPELDGNWLHWTQHAHTPPDDIASDYYPALGAYSSNDPHVVAQHMAWLRQAGIGVVIVSWWGRHSDMNRALPLIFRMAAQYGIQVALHIEPYDTRTADSLVDDIQYLYAQYGDMPAFFRSSASSPYSTGKRPRGIFFVWCTDSPGACGQQTVDPGYWQSAMDRIHALPEGALMIANTTDGTAVRRGHFDGLYNYSTLHPEQHDYFAWARTLPPGALYIPSVIPGFSASRVGYAANMYVPRLDGRTYDDQWSAALDAGVVPFMVTITSFNEWHEGTIIEPPVVGRSDGQGYSYSDFGALGSEGYLALTRSWVQKYNASFPLEPAVTQNP